MSFHKKIILLIILLSYFDTGINASIVITGLARMQEELSLTTGELSWVQTSYLLTWGGCLLLGGKLSDVYGRRRILILSLFLFGAGCLLSAWTDAVPVMLAARVIQGMAAAILSPTSLALLIDCFDGQERIRAVAWYSSIAGLSTSVGLVLGGALASFLSWRIGFVLNGALTFFLLALSMQALPHAPRAARRLDQLGAFLSMAGIFAFVYAINGAALPLPCLAFSAISLAAFLLRERRTEDPIMPLSLFGDRMRTGAYLVRTLFMCGIMGFWFSLSVTLQSTKGYSPLMTSLAYLPMTAALFLTALAVPHLIGRYGNRNLLLAGTVLVLLCYAGLLSFTAESPYFSSILPPLLLCGTGQGLLLSPMTQFGLHSAAPHDAGAASGLVNATHQIGGAIGVAAMASVSSAAPDPAGAFHLAVLTSLAFTLPMLPLSLWLFQPEKH